MRPRMVSFEDIQREELQKKRKKKAVVAESSLGENGS